MQHVSRPDLWRVIGYYINLCMGHAPPYLRFCSYAHIRHLGYTVDDLYSCQDIVVVTEDTDSFYDPLILFVDIFQYVATDKTVIGVENNVDQELVLMVLQTISNLQMSKKGQYISIEAVTKQLLSAYNTDQSEVLRHINLLVEHKWLQQSKYFTNMCIGISIPGHSEIISNLQHAEETLLRRLLHDPIPFITLPVTVKYAPLIKEYALGAGGEDMQQLPINFHAVYGAEYHLATLLGNKTFTICSTEQRTYIGIGDIFS